MQKINELLEIHNKAARHHSLKDKARDEIEQLTCQFLLKGGAVKAIPSGTQKDAEFCSTAMGIRRNQRIELKIPMQIPKSKLSQKAAGDDLCALYQG